MSHDGERSPHSRRSVLALSAASLASLTGLAGCTGGGGSGGDGSGAGGSGSGGDSGGSNDDGSNYGEGGGSGRRGESLAQHPAGAAIDAQPRLGPEDAGTAIVAFEDPSCARCAAFDRNTLPRLKEHVDAGRLRFFFRVYPVVYEWGKPAVQALEATYARDESAFWALKSHYFAEQSSFSTNNVLRRSREFLAAETSLDADAVVADAEAKAYDDAVQADLDAGDTAGAGRTTPTLFLFGEDGYLTKVAGSVSYELVAASLGLE